MNMSKRGRIAEKLSATIDVVWAMASAAADGRLPQSAASDGAARTSSDTPNLEGEKSRSLGTGIRFYPSSSLTAVKIGAGIGEFKNEDHDARDNDYQLQQQQPHGLDPTAIFKNVTQAETWKLAPEQNITLFALRLAMMEKSASGIGTLSFIWASTIILGGFASNINPVDFIVIATILVTEGTRIFSRSRELEWQHLASKSTDTSMTYRREMWLKLGGRHSTKDGGTGVATREDPTSSSEPPGPGPGPGPEPEPGPGPALEPTDKLVPRRDGSQEDLESGERTLGPISSRCLPSIRICMDKATGEKMKRTVDAVDAADLGKYMDPKAPSIEPSGSDTKLKNRKFTSKTAFQKYQKNLLISVNEKNIKRTWSSQVVPMLPGGFTYSMLSTRGVSAILYCVQLTSAIICLVLSCWRLSKQQFNPAAVSKEDTPVNLYTSLNIFYGLALTEAFLFLLERCYWEYQINYEHLMMQVTNKAELGEENEQVMTHFFYEVYKKCIDGSVFDGLDMDLVDYSFTLLQSDNSYEQLGGLRVLRRIVDRYDGFSADALKRIGTVPGVIERLVEMLSWRSPHQEDIRLEDAALICRAVRYSKNCVRIAAVPGSMDGIVSLVKPPERDLATTTGLEKSVVPLTSVHTVALRLDGLRILVAEARDPVNLIKIGETRGLVPILVSFIAVNDVRQFKSMEGDELKTYKKVLRLLAMLAGARNISGTVLRPLIARVVSGIASLRDILEFGGCHPQLQWMAIEILTNLALDDDIRRAIGSTGGIIRNLFTLYITNLDGSGAIFATEVDRKVEKAVSKRAGDALNFLAVQNRKNCLRMMDLQDESGKKTFIPALINLISQHREQTICAAKILRSLMEYGSHFQKREIVVCSPRVMRLMMGSSSQKMQEAIVGLAARMLAVLEEPVYNQIFESMDRAALIQKLLRSLEYNSQTSSRFPRIRRHSIEFILTLVKRDRIILDEFTREGLENKLARSLDTISEVENFVTFSGAEGLTRHSIAMEDLVQISLQELRILT